MALLDAVKAARGETSTPSNSGGGSLLNAVKSSRGEAVSQPAAPVQITQPKSVFQKGQDIIKSVDFGRAKESLIAGIKQVPGQIKQAGGIILSSLMGQQKAVENFYKKLPTPVKSIVSSSSIFRGAALKEKIEKISPEAVRFGEEEVEKKAIGLREAGVAQTKKVREEYAAKFPQAEGLQKYIDLVAMNLPQVATTMALTVGTALVTKNPQLAATVGLSTSYGLGASEVYDDARSFGLSDSQALPLAQVGGVIIGAIDFLPLTRLIRKTGAIEPIKQTIIKKISSGLISLGIQSGFEGITEAAQEIVGNAISSTYNENQDLFEGVTEAAVVGAILGGMGDLTVQGVVGITGKNQSRIQETVQNAIQTPEEERTPEQQEIYNAVFTNELTPDQALSFVTENKLSQDEAGKKIVLLAVDAKRQGKNIQFYPAGDEIKVELVDPQAAPETKQPEIPRDVMSTEDLVKIIGDEKGGFRTEEQIAALRASIEKSGITYPIELIEKADGTYEINDGTHRIRIAQDLGIEEIPVEIVKKETAETEKKITITPNKKLEGTEKTQQDFGSKYISENLEEAVTKYEQRIQKDFGGDNIVSADEAKYVIPEFDATKSRSYHEPASALSKYFANKLLSDPKNAGKPVLLMAGGSGAGKTTLVRDFDNFTMYALVYDSNLANFDTAVRRIKQALDQGREVYVDYILRDPMVSFEGVIRRVKTRGRIVPIEQHIINHLESLKTIKRLNQEYGDRISIKVFDNNGKTPKDVKEIDIKTLDTIAYNENELRKQLNERINQAVKNGEITEKQAVTFRPEGTSEPGTASRKKSRKAKTKRYSSVTDSAYEQIVKNGGVTINLAKDQPKNGFAYAPNKNTERVFDAKKFSEKDVVTFVKDNFEELQKEGNHLGAWEDNGKIYLDISRVGKPNAKTISEAQKASQLAVFDLENFKSVSIGEMKNGVYNSLDEATNIFNQYRREISEADRVREEKSPEKISPSEKVAEKGVKTPSKIARSIEQKAIEKGLTKKFQDLAGYEKINIEDQARRAAEVMGDLEKARRVIRGEESLPSGLNGVALITAGEEYIKKTGDAQFAYDLANSPLVSQTSEAAQALRLAAEREPDSIAQKILDLRKAREKALKKKTGKTEKQAVNDEVKRLTESMKKSASTKYDWNTFIKSIEC